MREDEPQPAAGDAASPKLGTQGFRVSGTYSFLPHHQTFRMPVQVAMEYDEQVNSDGSPKTEQQQSDNDLGSHGYVIHLPSLFGSW